MADDHSCLPNCIEIIPLEECEDSKEDIIELKPLFKVWHVSGLVSK